MKNLYSRLIFPRLIDWCMAGDELTQYRRQVLAEAVGNVLEIGFGTGLNLPYYPETVEKLTAIEPNSGMNQLAQKRLSESSFEVDVVAASGENLPFSESCFDCVVSTWTLCSIPQVEAALAEICRVLRSGGKFLFIEHGLSPEPGIATWQNRLTPIQKRLADGCHLNRNIEALVKRSGFASLEIERFYARDEPKLFGYLYQGTAIK